MTTTVKTKGEKETSLFVRFGDWLSNASMDRSGLTEVTIRLMRDDCHLATRVSEIHNTEANPLTPQEVEVLMDEKHLKYIADQTGQSLEAIEDALTEVLPMLGNLLRVDPERLFQYQCKI